MDSSLLGYFDGGGMHHTSLLTGAKVTFSEAQSTLYVDKGEMDAITNTPFSEKYYTNYYWIHPCCHAFIACDATKKFLLREGQVCPVCRQRIQQVLDPFGTVIITARPNPPANHTGPNLPANHTMHKPPAPHTMHKPQAHQTGAKPPAPHIGPNPSAHQKGAKPPAPHIGSRPLAHNTGSRPPPVHNTKPMSKHPANKPR